MDKPQSHAYMLSCSFAFLLLILHSIRAQVWFANLTLRMTKWVTGRLHKQFLQLVRLIQSGSIPALEFCTKGSTTDTGYFNLTFRCFSYLNPNVIVKDESINHKSFISSLDLLKAVFIYACLYIHIFLSYLFFFFHSSEKKW